MAKKNVPVQSDVKVGKFRGIKTGMRVMEFQDHQLVRQTERKLSDDELLDEMRDEFPETVGKIFTADRETRRSILRAVRNLYNAGKHSKAAPKPEVPVVEYRDGQPVGGAKKEATEAAA